MRMKADFMASGKRRPVNLSLDTGVVEAARAAGINLSQACETALRQAAEQDREQRWQAENRASIEAWNAWTEAHGLPLGQYRPF